MLLVTPLQPRALIQGRMAVLIRQFAPASAAVIACLLWREFDFVRRHGVVGWEMGFGPGILWLSSVWGSMAVGVLVSVGAGGRVVWQGLAVFLPPVLFVGLLGLLDRAVSIGGWGLPFLMVLTVALMGAGGFALLRIAERRLLDRVYLRG